MERYEKQPRPQRRARSRARLLILTLLLMALAVLAAVVWISFGRANAQQSRRRAAADAQTLPSTTPRPSRSATPSPAFPSAAAIVRALDWAEDRAGEVGVAVVDNRGALHTYNAHRQFQSASVAKAMLLVAYLRRHPRPTTAMRLTLRSMIEKSDNVSADTVYGLVGNRGLLGVAKLAGMRDFDVGTSWINTRMTAADQARFFYRYESYLPTRSIAFARQLLSGITPLQRWGIAAAAGTAGWKVFFKGGWLGEYNEVMNQAAWLERGGVRWSLAVLTDDNPTSSYGRQTQKGITGLLLGHKPTAAYLAVVR